MSIREGFLKEFMGWLIRMIKTHGSFRSEVCEAVCEITSTGSRELLWKNSTVVIIRGFKNIIKINNNKNNNKNKNINRRNLR